MANLKGYAGADLAFRHTVRDAETGDAITTWLGGATLAIDVWQGDDQATLFHPTAAWINPLLGTIREDISGADTADLPPGVYLHRLTIDNGTQTAVFPLQSLELLAAPGTGTAPTVYGEADDLYDFISAAVLDPLKTDADQSGWVEQRHRARTWLDETIVARALRVQDLQAVLHGPDPVIEDTATTDGYDYGAWWGASGRVDSVRQDAEDTTRAALDADALVVDDTCREIVARMAISYILATQLGAKGEGETDYQRIAAEFRGRAIQMLPGWAARLCVAVPGVVDRVYLA